MSGVKETPESVKMQPGAAGSLAATAQPVAIKMTTIPVRVVIAADLGDEAAAVIFKAAAKYAGDYGLRSPGGSLERTQRGKPYFGGGGPEFSISHSGSYWVMALAPFSVGVDVQEEKPCAKRAIARRHFHPTEYEWLEAGNFSRFYDLWAARESYVKFTGSGIDNDFHKFLVTEDGPGLFHVGEAWIYQLAFKAGYSLCVCCGQPVPVEIVMYF